MIKQSLGISAVIGLGLLTAFVAGGCSSSDPEPANSGGTSSSGGSAAGTTSAGGSAAGTTSAGGSSAGTTGAGGSTAGSTGSGGGGGTGTASCKGIGKGDPCAPEGQACPNLVCGLADSGSRECNCTGGVWTCTSCDFTGTPYAMPPDPPAPTCTTEADGQACTMVGALCTGAPGMEVCACYLDDEMMSIWDCDDIPWE